MTTRSEYLARTLRGGVTLHNRLVHELARATFDGDEDDAKPAITASHRKQVEAMAAGLEAKGEKEHAAAIRSLVPFEAPPAKAAKRAKE